MSQVHRNSVKPRAWELLFEEDMVWRGTLYLCDFRCHTAVSLDRYRLEHHSPINIGRDVREAYTLNALFPPYTSDADEHEHNDC